MQLAPNLNLSHPYNGEGVFSRVIGGVAGGVVGGVGGGVVG